MKESLGANMEKPTTTTIVKEYLADGVIAKGDNNELFAMVSAPALKAILISLQNAEASVSKIGNSGAAVALQILRDKLEPVVIGMQNVERELGVETSVSVPEFGFEQLIKEMEGLMKEVESFGQNTKPQ